MIGLMVWNIMHGRGYNEPYKLPPLTTRNGKLIRLIALLLLIIVLFVPIHQGTQGSLKGWDKVVIYSCIVVFDTYIVIKYLRKNNS